MRGIGAAMVPALAGFRPEAAADRRPGAAVLPDSTDLGRRAARPTPIAPRAMDDRCPLTRPGRVPGHLTCRGHALEAVEKVVTGTERRYA